MRMRPLGRTGIQVSPYCLGTMMFGQAGNPDRDDCVRIIHRALDAGINVIDTADGYGPHSGSDEIVGAALKRRRDDVVLAIGQRAMGHLDDLLAGAAVTLDDELLDRIDHLVPPGTDIGPLDVSYVPPAIERGDAPSIGRRARGGITR
jgi:diketogulonate reductase-like aldo/keto reductase